MISRVVEALGRSANSNSDVLRLTVRRLMKAEVSDGEARDTLLNSEVAAHCEVQGHLIEIVRELHLDDLDSFIWLFLVVDVLHEVFGGDLILSATHINWQEVARLNVGGFESDACGLF